MKASELVNRIMIALAAMCASTSVLAATYTWTGGANDGGKWSTPGNWGKTSGYPGSASDDTANIKGDAEVTLDRDLPNNLLYLQFPFDASGKGRLNGEGRTITVETKVNFGHDFSTSSPTYTSSVVLDNVAIKYTGTSAMTVYQGTSLVLQNASTVTMTKTSSYFNLQSQKSSLTLDNSTLSVSVFRSLGGKAGTSSVYFRGANPLLKVRSQDSSGSLYMNTSCKVNFYFDVPKGGYREPPIQLAGTKALFAGSPAAVLANLYVQSSSEALADTGIKTYTLISSAAGTTTDRAKLNDIKLPEGSKTKASWDWEDETVEGVTTTAKYLKLTVENQQKGLIIFFCSASKLAASRES